MSEHDDTILRSVGGRARGVCDLPKSELASLLDDPDAPLWRYLDRPVKIGHTSLIVEAELPLGGRTVRVAYKQYRARNCWKSLLDGFRRSRARRSWDRARSLIARHIPIARPVALCEPRCRWLSRRSYLATEWIDGAENLHLYGWRLADCPDRQRLRHAARCAESLGRLVGRMHAARIANRDLKGANVLVVERGDRPATYLVDPDGARVCRRLSASRRASDIARLAVALRAHPWVTRSICCRFVRAYAGAFPPGTVVLKSLWRDVARRSRRIESRMHRRGEPVL